MHWRYLKKETNKCGNLGFKSERYVPMCFITIELQRSYGVTAIALWPVIAKNCDAVTHNHDKKIVVTRSYDKKS